jgi:hypothetical protein
MALMGVGECILFVYLCPASFRNRRSMTYGYENIALPGGRWRGYIEVVKSSYSFIVLIMKK